MTVEYLEKEIRRMGTIGACSPQAHGNIQQSPIEFSAFTKFMQDNEITSMLEVGSGQGASHKFLREVANIDCWSMDILEECKWADAMNPKQILHADSQSEEAINWAKENGDYGCVFIDASHHYSDVVEDYKNYAPMATKIVAFHDAVGLRQTTGVLMFYMELVGDASVPVIFFVDSSHEFRAGIAVMSVKDLKSAGKLWNKKN